MVAYNFQAQWSDAVRAGVLLANNTALAAVLAECGDVQPKRTTIRANNKKRVYPGVLLQLYTGQRTPQCAALGVVTCLGVTPIRVESAFVQLDQTILTSTEWHLLAMLDTAGLWDGDELLAFIKQQYGLPFSGKLIMW